MTHNRDSLASFNILAYDETEIGPCLDDWTILPQCQLERPMAETTNAAISNGEIAALHDVFLALVSLTAII